MKAGSGLTFGLTSVWRSVAIAGLIALAACTTLPPEPPPAEVPEPAIVVEATIPIIPAESPPEPTPEPPPTVVAPPRSVAIVMTSREPAYEDVVVELEKRFEVYSIYDLSDKSQPPVAAFRLINDSDAVAVVAIGLGAARSAVALAAMPVVFSQVFNFQDHDLVTETSRGVASIAPLDAQMNAWRDIEPDVSNVGIIVGEGHEELLAEAEIAASRHGVRLQVMTANSDQETLFLFKRMVQDIDGFWLFPDNRVLSARALREILQDTKRRRISVVVPNDAMLSMGASISITTVPADIADTIVSVVEQVRADRLDEVPGMTPLSAIRVTTRDTDMSNPMAASAPVERTEETQ